VVVKPGRKKIELFKAKIKLINPHEATIRGLRMNFFALYQYLLMRYEVVRKIRHEFRSLSLRTGCSLWKTEILE
jgi:hypothetical protein